MATAESPSEIAKVVKDISVLVSAMSGIQLGDKQYAMVESRLKGRMAKLRLTRFDEYKRYLDRNMHQESQALLSLMTTHHTFFFREFNHFEYLLNHGLNSLIEKARERGDKKIRIWSAAASRGQEAYSLAMFMKFHLSAAAPDVDFEIWGTDVDPESIQIAKNGVYKVSELKQAPSMYVTGNWIVGKGTAAGFYKIKSDLHTKCLFVPGNLLKNEDFLQGKSFDVIFCRNVFIYFNSQQIEQCTSQMLKHLDKDGFLFLGVSESLNGLKLPVEAMGSSVYRHPVSERSVKKTASTSILPIAPEPEKVYRVLSVDDSPAILSIMKKIIGTQKSFKHVGTASNGLEAIEFLKKNQVDLITLDLHMPEMDGLQFLGSSERDKSIPVLIVSSINREDTSIAQKALALGAADYVEKPSLENIGQATNEICAKLKSIAKLTPSKKAEAPSLAKGKKKVLIVDDSATIRQLLEKIISKDSELEVVGKAEKPSQVEDMIKKLKPDVITLDIHMPEMDGVTLLKRIHPLYRIPTVMISSISKEEGPQVLNALEIGAVDYIQKPEMSSLGAVESLIREKIKVAAGSKTQGRVSVKKARTAKGLSNKDLVLLGASTGGTEAIKHVLESLPAQIPPILIVQHIPAGFSAAFAKRMDELFPFDVKEASHGDLVKANQVLIAPGGKQMKIVRRGAELHVEVRDDSPVNRHKPSVDYMFASAVQLGLSHAVVVLMTGMGADGAREMKNLKNLGCTTIAQDQASCVVYGMPREAIEMGAASMIKSLADIGTAIMDQIEKNSSLEGKKSA